MNSLHKTKTYLCSDGSHTLYSEKFRQFYHNPNGAVAENRHVFFKTTDLVSRIRDADSYHILEVGFGTGLNLLVLLEQLAKTDSSPAVTYRSIEAYPLSLRQAMKLNYPDILDLGNAAEILACIFRDLKRGWNTIKVSNNVTLELYSGSFERFPVPEKKSGMIFFDPFSPDVNPELWSKDVFEKLAACADPNVLLSTYGAASSSRAAMAAAGWYVARAPGALGKREMTVASLHPDQLAGWKRVDEKRLSERYRNGEFAQ